MKHNFRQHLAAERRELLALCRALRPDEWEAPSLCAGWRVRDVVAHIIGNDRDLADFLAVRGDLDAATARSVARRRDWSTARLVDEVAAIAPVGGATRLFAGLLLVDNWIHHEDIRRPLGRARAQDAERLHWILRLARLTPYSRVKGLCLVATDLGGTLGRGPELRGPAADLILAGTGRLSAAASLSGPGLRQVLAAE